LVSSPLPPGALLAKYVREGAYTDCYVTDIAGAVSHAQYVEAFYTTAVFKLERLILKWAVSKPSTDGEARQLAAGTRDAFAAWRVEGRAGNQLLLCDLSDRTRSWLMVVPEGGRTQLYFGSAVVPGRRRKSLGFGFRALLGFHKLYSAVLLYAAKSRLESLTRSGDRP
jgi:hypothetical protein